VSEPTAEDVLRDTARKIEADLARVKARVTPLLEKQRELESALEGLQAAMRVVSAKPPTQAAGQGPNRAEEVRQILYRASGPLHAGVITDTLTREFGEKINRNGVAAILSRLKKKGQARSLGAGMWEAVSSGNSNGAIFTTTAGTYPVVPTAVPTADELDKLLSGEVAES
jgi:hypothetical protein